MHRFVVQANLDEWKFLSQKVLSVQEVRQLAKVFQYISDNGKLKPPQKITVAVQRNGIEELLALGAKFNITVISA